MATPSNTRLVLGPNASLSVRQAWLVMGVMSAVGFGIAGLWTLLGFWPVLPFAGLELAALGAALWVTQRRNRYREVLDFDGEALRIEFGLVGRGAQAKVELRRAWTRVALEPGQGNEPSRLVLSCSGQGVEIGGCLTDVERERLAARLEELLKTDWVSGSRFASEARGDPGRPARDGRAGV